MDIFYLIQGTRGITRRGTVLFFKTIYWYLREITSSEQMQYDFHVIIVFKRHYLLKNNWSALILELIPNIAHINKVNSSIPLYNRNKSIQLKQIRITKPKNIIFYTFCFLKSLTDIHQNMFFVLKKVCHQLFLNI